MHVFYSDPFTFPLPPAHRFPLAKYRLLRERVLTWPASTGVELLPAPRASDDELGLVHTHAYRRGFAAGTLSNEAMQRIGFPWSPELVERSLRSCGGTIAAARIAVVNGAAVYLAGGTHHARPDRGAGYCIYNDCAVAARVLQRQYGMQRVLIVDTDVHQGDGTAATFAGDDSVFTFSMHGAANFPAEKAHSDLDIALPDGTDDDDYLAQLRDGLDEAIARSTPEFVFFLSGADAFGGDRLGRLALSKAGLAARDEMVFDALGGLDVPHVTVMGGGYGKRIEDTVDIYEHTVRAAAELAERRQTHITQSASPSDDDTDLR